MAPTMLTEPVRIPAAWKGADLERDRSWIRHLTPAEIADLDAAVAAARASGAAGKRVLAREDFPLSVLDKTLEAALEELTEGRGIVLLRGLPVERYDGDDLLLLWRGIGAWLGEAVSQNAKGEMVSFVTEGGAVTKNARGRLIPLIPEGGVVPYHADPNQRGYRTRSELRPHNDSADLVGLLCVHPAKSGGLSTVVSSMAIFNEIVEKYPQYLEPLFTGYHYDVRGEGATGSTSEVTRHKVPVYSWFAGRLSCRFNVRTIETAQIKMGKPLSELELEAVRCVERLAMSPELRFDLTLQQGDMQILNNLVTLHARTDYEDWPEPERKRMLLRLWLNLRDGPPLAPEFADRYNVGPRSGIRPQVPI